MHQSCGEVRGRSFGPSLLLAAVLSVGLCPVSSGAVPQSYNQLEVRAPYGQSHGVNLSLQRRVARSAMTAGAEESPVATKTFVDMTSAELAKAVPELNRLKPAESQEMLPQILDRAGSAEATFVDHFPDTACTEHANPPGRRS